MIKELIKLANHLDGKGFRKEADRLDKIISVANETLRIIDPSSASDLDEAKLDKHIEVDGYFMDGYISEEAMKNLHKKVEEISSQKDLDSFESQIPEILDQHESDLESSIEGDALGHGRFTEEEDLEDTSEKEEDAPLEDIESEPIPGSRFISSSYDKSTGIEKQYFELNGRHYTVINHSE